MKDVSILIAAAGRGTRFGSKLSKPFVSLAGQPIVCHSLTTFASLDSVCEITLIVHPDDIETVRKKWHDEMSSLGMTNIVEGGEERQDSIAAGLRSVSEKAQLVAIHDAARPLVSAEMIERCIDRARTSGAAILAVPANATIKEANGEACIVRTVPREALWMAQTPQIFSREIILSAYRNAEDHNLRATDDAQLVEMLGHQVEIVKDSYDNIKITTSEDLELAEALLARRRGGGSAGS